jgi:hypothetical protein
MVKIKKEKVKTLFIVLSFVLSLITTIAVCFGIANATKTTETVGVTAFELGSVDESGKVIESKKSSVMENAQNVDGLTIDIDEETATVTYRVVFYGEDGEYLSTTETLETDYDATSTPETAETFRVVITPDQVDGEDVKINIFTMNKYAKQLEITYNKKGV